MKFSLLTALAGVLPAACDSTGSEVFCVTNPDPNDLMQSTERLRELYLHYEMCEEKHETADRILDELVLRKDPESVYGRALEYDLNRDPSDDEKAVALMKEAAELGHEPAQRDLEHWVRTGRIKP